VPESEAENPEGEASEGEEAGKYRGNMRYRKQRRGGKGLRDIRTSERNGPVVGAISVRDGDDIMLITVQGMVNRTHVDEIRVVGRNTQGVRIMGLNEGDKIASIAKIAKEEDAETEESDGTTVPPSTETSSDDAGTGPTDAETQTRGDAEQTDTDPTSPPSQS
jgi:DNA gyrase subunit A